LFHKLIIIHIFGDLYSLQIEDRQNRTVWIKTVAKKDLQKEVEIAIKQELDRE
jgi:hypothetical protein